ncbi:hypothetical protein LAV60_16900 [Clostridium sporogenes]|uniref:hypothetical protein n=1 Tax=Clostridium sporogenes TaxID=1509 RepID=UPI0013D78091|nr:hypothetical protein [Clostridium sporogenes]MCR1975864.1 hypothetical protein [Clostridium sporogenes]MCW6094850.1 hypothetical protein [Clostridium sporogenes]NFG95557.1 hypothetical protein [Clostridium sporogenes]NFH31548.1 hypothetical protein [Clostridium sporogenes]NFL18954.1 hypothetical protein [Clostridium sporogenes]
MKNKIISIIILLTMLLAISGCSSKPNKEVNTSHANNAEQKQEEYNRDEYQKIHDFVELKFQSKSKAAAVFVQASEKFQKPIIEIMRAHNLISNDLANINLSQAEIDTMNMDDIKSMYVKKGNKWYYGNKEINVGTPLPVPNSMKEKSPAKGKEINVDISLETSTSNGSLNIKGKTNLPDNIQLMIRLLKSADKSFVDQDFDVKALNGKFSTSFTSIPSGNYIIEITTPSTSVLDSSVKAKVGNNGANLCGENVVFDKVYGKTVKYENLITIK